MGFGKYIIGIIKKKSILFILLVVAITIIGGVLRVHAANRLPIESDERTYLRAAFQYNDYIRQDKLKMVAHYTYNFEHPPYYKIIYGVSLLTQPQLVEFYRDEVIDNDFVLNRSIEEEPGKQWGLAARYTSVFFGVLTTFVLSITNPLAGLFFAVDSLAVKYDSLVFLEALPVLTNLLAAWCYLHWYKNINRKPDNISYVWFYLSAIFVGVSIACKYSYTIVGIVIVIHLIGSVIFNKISVKPLWKILTAWAVLVLIAFVLRDPYIWKHTDTLNSFIFHFLHTQSEQVKAADYPFWQPFIWLSLSAPYRSDNTTSFFIGIDLLISLMALIGLPRLIKHHPFFFIWLVIGMTMLLAWTTKWPQYTMIIMVPLCMSASMGMGWIFCLLNDWMKTWSKTYLMILTLLEKRNNQIPTLKWIH